MFPACFNSLSSLNYLSSLSSKFLSGVLSFSLLNSFTNQDSSFSTEFMSDTGRPLPKFGEWDVNDPASAEGFTVIFNKARDEKKTGGNPDSPGKAESHVKPGVDPAKPQPKKWLCCFTSS